MRRTPHAKAPTTPRTEDPPPPSRDDELVKACGPHGSAIIKAGKAARWVECHKVGGGVHPAADIPHFWEWGAGVPLFDLALQMGDDAFFWPPFWARLRWTIANARTPDNALFGDDPMDQREASDHAAKQLKRLFEYYSKRGKDLVGRPLRWTMKEKRALRLEYDAVPANRKPRWREEKKATLRIKEGTLRRYLSEGKAKP